MTLRLKALLAVAVCMTILFAALYTILSSVILRGFDRVEKAYGVSSMDRLVQAVVQSEQIIDNSLWAFSSWGAAYQFATDKNVTKARAAGFDNVFSSSPVLDFWLTFDRSGKCFYSEQTSDSSNRTPETLRRLVLYFEKNPQLLLPDGERPSRMGFIPMPEGIYLVAVRPILRSDNSGPSTGAMVFGQQIDQGYLKNIGDVAGLPCRSFNNQPIPAGLNLSILPSHLHEGIRFHLSEQGEDSTIKKTYPAFIEMLDLLGKTNLIIATDLPRTIYQHAQSSLSVVMWSIALLSLAVCGLILVVIDQLVLKRVWKLNREVLAIGSSRRLESRVIDKGNDELGELGRSINTMLQDLHLVHCNLDGAKHKAESADRTKSEFVANMSHEIRTPLNAILGFTELLKKQITEPKAAGYLNSIATSGKSLLALINDILDLSKIEAGRMELKPEPLNIRILIGEMREIFLVRAREKNISLYAEVTPSTPARLYLDEIRLRQVLFNLIGNAIKFTDRGSITVRVDTEAIPDEPDHRNVTIDVIDTGVGIPPDQQDIIFEAFRQREGQSTRKYGGTGLGLTITRRLVSMMPGSIRVMSELGLGSTFRVYLPAVPSLPDEETVPVLIDEDLHSIHFYPANVLLVDDDEINRTMVLEQLDETGLDISEADSGEQSLVLAAQNPPDLVIMDLRMPGLNGYEAAQALRRDPHCKDIPIILMTASHVGEEFKDIDKYCQAQLRKPVTQHELITQLSRFLPHRIIKETTPVLADSLDALPEPTLNEAQRLALGHYLERTALPRWGALGRNFVMDEIEAFARDLLDQVAAVPRHPIALYASELVEATQSFELNRVRSLLTEFPQICQPYLDQNTSTLPNRS